MKAKMTTKELQDFINNVEIIDEGAKLVGQCKIGEPITVAGVKWIPLEKRSEGVYCITADNLCRMAFGKNNNLKESDVLEYLEKKAEEFMEIIGEDGLIEFDTDLTSDDGLDDYGVLRSKISLITCDSYRKNTRTIEKCDKESGRDLKSFFTATPDSTPSRGDSTCVRCVCSGFDLYCGYCRYENGVRPVVIFNPNIFQS